MSDQEKLSDAVNAVANLAKVVPVYDDAIQPFAIETGKALGTVGRAVNVALAPFRGFVWGGEQVEKWISSRVTEKLKNVPEEKSYSGFVNCWSDYRFFKVQRAQT